MTITALPRTPIARLLADAPVEPYPMLEAALGWAELRPSDWRWLGPGSPSGPTRATASAPAASGRYSVVASTANADAAARMARLLSTMTWAMVRSAADGTLEIQVPNDGYHRVIRALTGAWRDGRRMLGTAPAAAAHRPAARALWRMAIVLHPAGPDTGPLTVPVHGPQAAAMLANAAAALGLPHVVNRGRGGVNVVCADRRKLFHTLTAAPSRV
jgi:hypothetical protein